MPASRFALDAKRAAGESGLFLTESEISATHIPIGGIDPRLADSRARRGRRLFESMGAHHNPRREPERKGEFPIFFGRNPLKSPDSEK
jgi:hypothetical protein